MKHGFVKVASATPDIKVADPEYNRIKSVEVIKEAATKDASVIVLPELVISSYTCNDLFLQGMLLNACKEQLVILMEETKDVEAVLFIGLPWEEKGKIYNVSAVVYKGDLLAVITKKFIPNYSEFYEARYFASGPDEVSYIQFNNKEVPFGCNILLQNKLMPEMTIGCEICEDLWVPESPSTEHALAGANLLVNLSASDELVGKAEYRKSLVSMTSARLIAGYIYTSAGLGESTQDMVFGG